MFFIYFPGLFIVFSSLKKILKRLFYSLSLLVSTKHLIILCIKLFATNQKRMKRIYIFRMKYMQYSGIRFPPPKKKVIIKKPFGGRVKSNSSRYTNKIISGKNPLLINTLWGLLCYLPLMPYQSFAELTYIELI